MTLGVQVTHPSIEYGYLIPQRSPGGPVEGLQAYPLQAFEEKPKPARAAELASQVGVAWNAGMFLWRAVPILAALERYSGLVGLLEPTIAAPVLLAHAVRPTHSRVSIDYAVMEGAARDGRS